MANLMCPLVLMIFLLVLNEYRVADYSVNALSCVKRDAFPSVFRQAGLQRRFHNSTCSVDIYLVSLCKVVTPSSTTAKKQFNASKLLLVKAFQI